MEYYTCTFCFKSFPSAQALGGHQNAHRTERMEEKKLYIKDPIGYRKRAFLRSVRQHSLYGHRDGPSSSMVSPMAGNRLQYRAIVHGNNLYQPYLRYVKWKLVPPLVLNLVPETELRSVVGGGGGGGGGCMDVSYGKAKASGFNGGKDYDSGINCQMLDLTLKL